MVITMVITFKLGFNYLMQWLLWPSIQLYDSSLLAIHLVRLVLMTLVRFHLVLITFRPLVFHWEWR